MELEWWENSASGWCWQLLIVFGGGLGWKEEVVMGGVDGGCMQI